MEGHPQGSGREQDPLRADRARGDPRRRVRVRHARCSPRRSRRRSTTSSPTSTQNTDAVVRVPERLSSDFGSRRASERPVVACSPTCRARNGRRRGRRRRAGRVRAGRRQGRQGDRQPGPGSADASASGGTPTRSSTMFHLVDGAVRPTQRSGRDRPEHRRRGQGLKVGDRVTILTDARAAQVQPRRHRDASAPPTAWPGASASLFTMPEGAAPRELDRTSLPDHRRGRARRVADASCRTNIAQRSKEQGQRSSTR